jgi:hypothetical protein
MASGDDSSHVLGVIVAFVVPMLVLDRGKTGLGDIAAVFAIAFPLLGIRTSKRSLPASNL